MPECVVDPEQPPASAAGVPDQVKGQVVRSSRCFPIGGTRARSFPVRGGLSRNNLDAPDLVVHKSLAAAQRSALFLGPPLAAFKPMHRFSADRIFPASPMQLGRQAIGSADNVHGLTEHAHSCLRKRNQPAVDIGVFEYVFEQEQSTPGPRQNLGGVWTDGGSKGRMEP